MMFSIDTILEKQALQAKLHKALIVILSGLCGLLWWGWLHAPQQITIYLPPDISNGSTQTLQNVPKAFLYSFTFHIWQALYYWPTVHANQHGDLPYKAAILRYHAYLTPAFQRLLLKEYEQLKAEGHLDRTREIHSPLGAAYKVNRVKRLTADSWEVDIDVELIERTNAMIVKQVTLRYPLKVIRYDVSREANPYGLALAGFVRRPERIKREQK